ncbi:MAG: hypothetical protein AAF740_04120 [Bacteroidota bacterium]
MNKKNAAKLSLVRSILFLVVGLLVLFTEAFASLGVYRYWLGGFAILYAVFRFGYWWYLYRDKE